MKREQLAAIFLAVIIFAGLSSYLVLEYRDEIFGEDETNDFEVDSIELGDCADVNYIGKFTDGTIFDSSYSDVENKTDGTPLNVFVSLDTNETSPVNYEQYSAGLIDGFMNGLIGLEQGQTTTIGPIPPEEGYGLKLMQGDTFSSANLAFGLNQTLEVTNIDSENMTLKWIDIENLDNFTMPEWVFKNLSSMLPDEMIIVVPPYYIWKNSTEIIEINNEEVIVKTTPTKSDNLYETITQIYITTQDFIFILPNVTVATWDDTTITITISPEIGDTYQYQYFDQYGQVSTAEIEVENVTADKINVSFFYEGADKFYYEFNKTLEFNRTYSLPRYYNNLTLYLLQIFEILDEDLAKEGYSLNELAGEELIFEVTIEEVYKTSQSES